MIPLYVNDLQHYTGMNLVSSPFDGNGFGTWRKSMAIALSAKNKLGFITGKVKKPVNQMLDSVIGKDAMTWSPHGS